MHVSVKFINWRWKPIASFWQFRLVNLEKLMHEYERVEDIVIDAFEEEWLAMHWTVALTGRVWVWSEPAFHVFALMLMYGAVLRS